LIGKTLAHYEISGLFDKGGMGEGVWLRTRSFPQNQASTKLERRNI
jgi:hypothetical protein